MSSDTPEQQRDEEDPHSGPALVSIDRALRQLRLIVGAGVILQFVVSDHAGNPTIRTAAVAAAVALAVGLVNLMSLRSATSTSARSRTALQLGVLAADALFTLMIVGEIDLLDPEVSWALLIIPVLEAALRFRLRGAMALWLALSLAYVARELAIPPNFDDPLTVSTFLAMVQTLLYRAGIVLLVAVPGGYLSDQLVRAIDEQRQAQLEASRRSSLLVKVVDAGHRLGRLGAEFQQEVVSAALELGFDHADWCHQDEWGVWADSHAATASGGGELPPASCIAETLEQATRESRTYLVGPAEGEDELGDLLVANGLGVMVLCPVPGHQGSPAVLRAAVNADATPPDSLIECLELLAGQMSVARDNSGLVGRLKQAHRDLEHQATHDNLTGLANRLLFTRRLSSALATAETARGGRPLSILFIDLDRFKEVNDTLGHDVGDQLLVEVAKRLTQCVEANWTVARLGGDEFIILLPNTDEGGAAAAASLIGTTLNQSVTLGGHSVGLSGSIGVVTTSGGDDGAELMRRGDVAMYQAKAHGRSTWRAYSPELDRDNRSRNGMALSLRRALDQHELSADYQPVVRVSDGAIVGLEALARWTDPQHGTITPAQFIPVAEDSGLIDELGCFMLDEACARANAWQRTFPSHELSISVNVSPHQVQRDGFVELVMSMLARHRIPPHHLILELTERVMIEAEVREVLEQLRARNIRIAIDDFGAGHASIGSLWRLPIDILKIDRSFVGGAGDNPRRLAILRSMVQIGHDLGMTVVAEGVETGTDLEVLRQFGCDAVQGYHLFRPMSADSVTQVLSRPAPPVEAPSERPPAAQAAVPGPLGRVS
ncbi:MAG: bifunctional diguanylate cyclase/phosphodiesterase [Microthrixaceae bacterium]